MWGRVSCFVSGLNFPFKTNNKRGSSGVLALGVRGHPRLSPGSLDSDAASVCFLALRWRAGRALAPGSTVCALWGWGGRPAHCSPRGSLGRVVPGQFLEVWWGCGRPPGQAHGQQPPREPRVTAPAGWVPSVSARAPPPGRAPPRTWPPSRLAEGPGLRPACAPCGHAFPAFPPASRGSLTVRNNRLLSQECWSRRGRWLRVPLLLPTLGLWAGVPGVLGVRPGLSSLNPGLCPRGPPAPRPQRGPHRVGAPTRGRSLRGALWPRGPAALPRAGVLGAWGT